MGRSLVVAIALASAATVVQWSAPIAASERTLPMRFELSLQGPADVCGATCKTLISASGAITADSRPGEGATFRVELPLASRAAAAA